MVALVYVVMSGAIVVTAFLNSGASPGFCALGVSVLAPIGVGGTAYAAKTQRGGSKIASMVLGLAMCGLALWLSDGFSIRLFGIDGGGIIWLIIGGVVGLMSSASVE